MGRTRMDREERAKQFMPFSPLKGYEEALRKKEREIVPQFQKIRPDSNGNRTRAAHGNPEFPEMPP